MSTADLLHGHHRSGGMAPPPQSRRGAAESAAPDYHALGTFSETWAFLELFLDRCVSVIDFDPDRDARAPSSLNAKLDALDTAVRLPSPLKELAGEVTTLTGEVRSLAVKRQAVLQNVARASLNRLGMNLFAIPGATSGASGAGASFGDDETIEALHLRTCDLVRRSVLLIGALQARSGL